jgi:hypothetical protein
MVILNEGLLQISSIPSSQCWKKTSSTQQAMMPSAPFFHTLRCGLLPQGSFTSSDQAVYGPFRSRFAMALFRAPTTWTCHLANQRGALSHAQRAGNVYKAFVWSTRDSVLNASLSYVYNGITIASKISTDRPGSGPLIHARNQHDRTGSKPSTAGWPE